MGFFKTLFTGKEETEEEKQEQKKENDFDVFKYDGVKAMQIGKVDYAIACFDRALQIKDDVETHRFYANALLQKNDIEHAISQLEAVRTAEPENTETILALAELYYQTEAYDKLNEACQKAMEINPSLAAPHFILAKMQNVQKDHINAIAQLTQAIALKEDFADAYLLRAQVLFSMQQYSEAEKDIDIVISQNDSNDETLEMKAECCQALGKNEEAKTYYNKVIELNPYFTKAYLQLGQLLKEEGNTEEAAKIVEEGLKLQPDALKDVNGNYTNMETKMQETYDSINPFKH